MSSPLSDQEKLSIQTFCENQKQIKHIKDQYKQLKTPLNALKSTRRSTLLESLGEHECIKIDELYVVKKICNSTVQFSIHIVQEAINSITEDEISKYMYDKKCTLTVALINMLMDTMKILRTTTREYADVVPKVPKRIQQVVTSTDVSLSTLAKGYAKINNDLKKLNKEEKEKLMPHNVKVKNVESDINQYMKNRKLWSQRVNVNVEKTDNAVVQTFYLRRKISKKRTTIRVGDMKKMLETVVEPMELCTFEQFETIKETIFNKLVEHIENVPVQPVERVTFDKGHMKKKES
tara:strand:+ start:924 stop:1799 length:876 start_codon:yes stop_codon:yes gene_type:complete